MARPPGLEPGTLGLVGRGPRRSTPSRRSS